MATVTINTGLENGYKDFLTSLHLSGSPAIYRMLPSGSIETSTPCVFVIAGKSSEIHAHSGIYRTPIEVKIVYVAQDLQDNPAGLDGLTNAVETALTSSQAYINSGSNDIFMFSVTKPSHALEVVEQTYQYTITLESVCKSK
jgi:hypothetical protein